MHGTPRPHLSGLGLYLLVDPYFGEPSCVALTVTDDDAPALVHDRRQKAWQRDVHSAASSDHPIGVALLPYLVALNGADDEWLEIALDEAAHDHDQSVESGFHKIRTGTLIESDLGGEELMDRLQQMWTIAVSGKRRHLRLGSPRVMELVFHSADAQAIQVWLGPIARWHHLDRNGQWRKVRGQSDLDEELSDEDFYKRHQTQRAMTAIPPQLRCEGALRTALMHSETITQSLDAWQRMHGAGACAQWLQELLALLGQANGLASQSQEQKIDQCLKHLEKSHSKGTT